MNIQYRMSNIQCRSKNRVLADNSHLKKQSQFAGGHIGVRSDLKRSYGYIAANGELKNKAKQSQLYNKAKV